MIPRDKLKKKCDDNNYINSIYIKRLNTKGKRRRRRRGGLRKKQTFYKADDNIREQ